MVVGYFYLFYKCNYFPHTLHCNALTIQQSDMGILSFEKAHQPHDGNQNQNKGTQKVLFRSLTWWSLLLRVNILAKLNPDRFISTLDFTLDIFTLLGFFGFY